MALGPSFSRRAFASSLVNPFGSTILSGAGAVTGGASATALSAAIISPGRSPSAGAYFRNCGPDSFPREALMTVSDCTVSRIYERLSRIAQREPEPDGTLLSGAS
jgi:hypothetical protein